MRLLPALEHTLVSAYPAEEVMEKLISRTAAPDHAERTTLADFNGDFDGRYFSLSLVQSVGQNALPLVKGTVEETSKGSIIFLKLGLFPAARLFILGSSGMALLIGLVFISLSSMTAAGIASLALGVVNYAVLVENFHRKAKETIQVFHSILDKKPN